MEDTASYRKILEKSVLIRAIREIRVQSWAYPKLTLSESDRIYEIGLPEVLHPDQPLLQYLRQEPNPYAAQPCGL